MAIALCLIIFAVGAVLRYAITTTQSHGFDWATAAPRSAARYPVRTRPSIQPKVACAAAAASAIRGESATSSAPSGTSCAMARAPPSIPVDSPASTSRTRSVSAATPRAVGATCTP